MFEEVKEMIDSTIYTNGKGEVTAQNINLAMHGIVEATEEKIAEVESKVAEIGENSTGGSGALRWWLSYEPFGIIATPEQTQENIATYNKLVEDKYASVILCYSVDTSSFSAYSSFPVAVQHAIIRGEVRMIMASIMAPVEEGYQSEYFKIMPYSDGTMELISWERPSATTSNGPLRVWISELFETEFTSEQREENIRTYNALVSNPYQHVLLCTYDVNNGIAISESFPTAILVVNRSAEMGGNVIQFALVSCFVDPDSEGGTIVEGVNFGMLEDGSIVTLI